MLFCFQHFTLCANSFLPTTYIGAIPSVLNKVVDTLLETIEKIPGTSFVRFLQTFCIFLLLKKSALQVGLDEQSPLIAAIYLWVRPDTCGDFGRGVASCALLVTREKRKKNV